MFNKWDRLVYIASSSMTARILLKLTYYCSRCCLYQRLQMFPKQSLIPVTQSRSVYDQPQKMKKILIAIDFDHTIVDDNSDTVARCLVPQSSLTTAEEIYKSTDSWTLYMREIFRCLHKLNVTKEQIITAIHKIPPIKGMDSLIRNLGNERFEVIIISDSNLVFIEEWIKKQKLECAIKKIITNPAWFDESELLNIEFYHHQTFCDISEPNLCKGYALQTYEKNRQAEDVTFDHIVFIGDGSNDFCPTLKLSSKDFVFPRINYSLFKKIKQNEGMVKAQVYPWTDGCDIMKVFEEKFGVNFLKK